MGRPDARREDALARTLNGRFVDLRRFAQHLGYEFRGLQVVDLDEQLDL
jgi:hypothetical protein